MSTLAEIEEAVEALPQTEQEALLHFLAQRMSGRSLKGTPLNDPFAEIIGAFAGKVEATGRNAGEILYGARA